MTESPIGSPMLKARVPLVLDLPERGVVRRSADAQGHPPRARQPRDESTCRCPAATVADEILTRARELGYGHRDIAALHEVLSRTSVGEALVRVRRLLRRAARHPTAPDVVRACRAHSGWPGCAQLTHRFGCQAIAVRPAGATTSEDPTRVLVVDDEPNITELVSLGLRYEGVRREQRSRRSRGAAGCSRVQAGADDPRCDDAGHRRSRGRASDAGGEHLDAGDLPDCQGCDRGQDRGVDGRW